MGSLRKFFEPFAMSQGEMLKRIQKSKGKLSTTLSANCGIPERSLTRYRSSTHDLSEKVLKKLSKELGDSAYDINNVFKRAEPNLNDLGILLMTDDDIESIEEYDESLLETELLLWLYKADCNLSYLLADNYSALEEIYDFEWIFLYYISMIPDKLNFIGQFLTKCKEDYSEFILYVPDHLSALLDIKQTLYNENHDDEDKVLSIKKMLRRPIRLFEKSYIELERLKMQVQCLVYISEEMWSLLILFAQFQIHPQKPSDVQILILQFVYDLLKD